MLTTADEKTNREVEEEADKLSLKSNVEVLSWKNEEDQTAVKKPSLFNFSFLKEVVFSLFLTMAFFVFASITANVTFVSALGEEHCISSEKSAFLLSAMGIGDCASRPFAGLLFDLRMIRKYRVYLYGTATFMIGFSTLLMGLVAYDFKLLLMACLLQGLAGGSFSAAAHHRHWGLDGREPSGDMLWSADDGVCSGWSRVPEHGW